MVEKITAQSPTRIGLFGGGTDVEPFASQYGGKVLNLAIDVHHHCILTPVNETFSRITAMGETRVIRNGEFKVDKKDPFCLIYEIVKSYGGLPGNFFFKDNFDGQQSAGLGSSASAAVSMIFCFDKWLGIERTKYERAIKAWQMELNLGWISGWQDQFASSFGGVNVFEQKGREIKRISIPREQVDEFVTWCLLVYTGRKRHSSEIQKRLKGRIESGKAVESLKKIKELVDEGVNALLEGNYPKMGYLIDKSWQYKKQANPVATNSRIDKIYERAIKAGAIGGKVLGAGSNGYILFVVEPQKKDELFKRLGLEKLDFSIDYEGLVVK